MFSGFSTNSFGTGWTKLSIIRDSDDVQLLYDGIVYVGWCDLFDKRLENACHNHERTLSFVFLILVVSNCLSSFYPSSVFLLPRRHNKTSKIIQGCCQNHQDGYWRKVD